jgi:lysozyme
MYEKLKEHIKEYEGFSSLPYDCTAGFLTIGFGRNLEQRGITKEEAEILLANDIKIAENEISRIIKDWQALPEQAKIVLIDLTYNLGLKKLLTFEKMLDAVDRRDWESAHSELLDSKYARQVKRRARINASIFLSCLEDGS